MKKKNMSLKGTAENVHAVATYHDSVTAGDEYLDVYDRPESRSR